MASREQSISAAIDKLNSWVRSSSGRRSISSPTYAVYDWKLEWIRRAIAAETTQIRAIYLSLTCRDCGGSKRYTDSMGYEHPHCRKCSSTGMVRLEFLDTCVDGFRWHTPRERTWSLRLPEDLWKSASLSCDWEPNAKGRDLEPWEVAGCLNVLEKEMPNVPNGHSTGNDWDGFGWKNHKQYRLYVGQQPEACEFCGRFDAHRFHPCRGSIEWTAFACDACRGMFATANVWSDIEHKYVPSGGNGKSIFDEFKMPMQLLTHPEILKWLANRGIGGAMSEPTLTDLRAALERILHADDWLVAITAESPAVRRRLVFLAEERVRQMEAEDPERWSDPWWIARTRCANCKGPREIEYNSGPVCQFKPCGNCGSACIEDGCPVRGEE